MSTLSSGYCTVGLSRGQSCFFVIDYSVFIRVIEEALFSTETILLLVLLNAFSMTELSKITFCRLVSNFYRSWIFLSLNKAHDKSVGTASVTDDVSGSYSRNQAYMYVQ